ncbi:MAG: FHA domain-containing protein [Planctomycetota bacterium]
MQSSSVDLDTDDLSLETTDLSVFSDPDPKELPKILEISKESIAPSFSDPNETNDLTLPQNKITPNASTQDPNQTANFTKMAGTLSYQKILQAFKAAPFLKYQLHDQEQTFLLNRPEITIGRVSKNDLCLNVKNLSRIHCKIFRIRNHWYLEDYGSFNGTLVNGQKIAPQEKVLLSSNTTIRLGEIDLKFFLPHPGFLPASPFRRFLQWFPGVFLSILCHTFLFYVLTQMLISTAHEPEPPPLKVSLMSEKISKETVESILNEKIFEETKVIEETEMEVSPEVFEIPVELEEIPVTEPAEEFSPSDFSETLRPPTEFAWKSESLLGPGMSLPKGNWGGRIGKSKEQLLKKYGGGSETESAVESGLKWLAKHQSPSGYWDGGEFTKQCKEMTCSDARIVGIHREAITAFCLLAFLGAGHHEHQKGAFQETVRLGIRYLENQQNPDGSFGKNNTMYAHSIATLALCEAKQFEGKTRVKDPFSQRAIQYILDAQTPGAGWRYYFRDSSNDTSVTGWCIMALKAGKEAKISIPAEAFEGALHWLDSCTEKNYYSVGYMSSRDGSKAMTAVGVACRFFLGQNSKNPMVNGGINDLLTELPQESTDKSRYNRDYYYWYYGTLATFQYGGEAWDKWNLALKKALLPLQQTTGCERGSWGAYCRWFGGSGGRPLNTAIAILMLEIYYRYPSSLR